MMKKEYMKPQVVFSSFTLSNSIAGNCAHQNSLQTEGSCGLDFGGERIFLAGIIDCGSDPIEVDGSFNGICYHNPTETNNLFNS